MRQAIEEKFILDVLQNYISYKVAYKLAQADEEMTPDEVDKSKGRRALNRWVRIHPYNIGQKVQIIVEHFREHVAWRLNGTAKAMVVTNSREEVIRYKLEIDRYIQEKRYPIGTLVAFSGDIEIKELADLAYNERNMNPGLKGRDIKEALDTPDYQILLVANKYQTGFDQPKLVAMYVDKRLSGVATVQTLSRLNRTCQGKDWTCVVDFENDPEAILADFRQYYRSATLPEGTDPNLIYSLESKLDAQGIYLGSELDAFAEFYWNPKKGQTHSQLQKLLQPAAQRFKVRYWEALEAETKEQKDALELYVKDLSSYCKLYEFITQIYDYGDDLALEKRYAFFREIAPILYGIIRDGKEAETIDLSDVRLTHYSTKQQTISPLSLTGYDAAEFPPAYGEVGSGASRDPERVKLLELIEELNDLFGGDCSDTDLVNYAYGVRDKLMENALIRTQAKNNTKKQFDESDDLHEAILSAVEDQNAVNGDLARRVMNDARVRDEFIRIIRDITFEKIRKDESA
jgi:type I restriction enzyme R subunit